MLHQAVIHRPKPGPGNWIAIAAFDFRSAGPVFAGFGRVGSWPGPALSGAACLWSWRGGYPPGPQISRLNLLVSLRLFIVVEGLAGGVAGINFTARCEAVRASASSRLESRLVFGPRLQIFSNVTIRSYRRKDEHFNHPELMWKVMALSTTFAGKPHDRRLGCHIIVMESARGHAEIGFWITPVGIPYPIDDRPPA